MTQVFIVVEGWSEEAFVRRVLAPHLANHDCYPQARVVTTRRNRRSGAKEGRGGGHGWSLWEREIRQQLDSDTRPGIRFSTMIDLYRYPEGAPRPQACGVPRNSAAYVDLLEAEMARRIHDPRFIPYVQRHEFEALILAAVDELAQLIDGAQQAALQTMLDGIRRVAPEDVNDGPDSSPSKRLARVGFKKLLHGPDVLQRAGLAKVRASCPRFDAWLSRLEQLSSNAP